MIIEVDHFAFKVKSFCAKASIQCSSNQYELCKKIFVTFPKDKWAKSNGFKD